MSQVASFTYQSIRPRRRVGPLDEDQAIKSKTLIE